MAHPRSLEHTRAHSSTPEQTRARHCTPSHAPCQVRLLCEGAVAKREAQQLAGGLQYDGEWLGVGGGGGGGGVVRCQYEQDSKDYNLLEGKQHPLNATQTHSVGAGAVTFAP